MPKYPKNKSALLIPQELIDNLLNEQKKIVALKEWRKFELSINNIRRSFDVIPFDWRFNAVYWALDVSRLCHEIVYSLCWMKAYAKFYRSKVKEGSEPSHTEFHVSYFADNCITRIDSCRDKIALMVWAYYCPFNPENPKEVLVYEEVVERLRVPIKFGLKLRGNTLFLKHLVLLTGNDFKRIEKYRHLKIHRREPQIELYKVKSHHYESYMIPLSNLKEIECWKKERAKQYPDNDLRKGVEKRCYKNGILFDQKRLRDHLWEYNNVETFINECFLNLIKAGDGCFRILRLRKPLRKG